MASTRQQDPGPILITIIKRERDKINNLARNTYKSLKIIFLLILKFLPSFQLATMYRFASLVKVIMSKAYPAELGRKIFHRVSLFGTTLGGLGETSECC